MKDAVTFAEGRNQPCRNGAIDFLRFVGINCIVFLHFQQFTEADYFPIDFFGGYDFATFVELFFAISGFCSLHYIDQLCCNQQYIQMLLKRFIRILAPAVPCAFFYSITMIIYRIVEGNWFYDESFSIINLLASLCGIQFAWFIPPGQVQGVIYGINPPTWYIDSLLLCFVIMTFLVWLSNKTHISPAFCFFFVALMGAYTYKLGLNFPFLNWAACRGYYAFFTGILLAMFDRMLSSYKYDRILRYITICLLMIIGIGLYECGSSKVFILTFLIFPALILLCTTDIIKKTFNHRVWKFLGNVSYEVYLWHFSFILYFIILRNRDVIDFCFATSSYLCLVLFAVFVWIISILAYIVVEQKLIKRVSINDKFRVHIQQ